MSKRLNPEIKSMKALLRAVEPLDDRAKNRVLNWFESRVRSDLKAADKENG